MMETSTPVCHDCKYLQDVKSRICDAFPTHSLLRYAAKEKALAQV